MGTGNEVFDQDICEKKSVIDQGGALKKQATTGSKALSIEKLKFQFLRLSRLFGTVISRLIWENADEP